MSATASQLLAPAAESMAPLLVGSCQSSVGAFDAVIEEHLSRTDEASALLDSSRIEVSNSLDNAYPQLLKSTAELQALFATIDAAEGAVARVHAAAKAGNDRLELLTRGADSKYPEAGNLGSAISGAARSLVASVTATFRPGGDGGGGGASGGGGGSALSSFLGAFGRGGGSKAPAPAARAIDEPVVLPPWDPASARVSAGSELAALSYTIGDVPSILAAHRATREAAAASAAESADTGGPLDGAADGYRVSAAGAGGAREDWARGAGSSHDDGSASPVGGAGHAGAEEHNSGEDVAFAPVGSSVFADDDGDEGGAEAGYAAAPAPAAAAAAAALSPASKRLAVGEDDEEEEEEEEEDE